MLSTTILNYLGRTFGGEKQKQKHKQKQRERELTKITIKYILHSRGELAVLEEVPGNEDPSRPDAAEEVTVVEGLARPAQLVTTANGLEVPAVEVVNEPLIVSINPLKTAKHLSSCSRTGSITLLQHFAHSEASVELFLYAFHHATVLQHFAQMLLLSRDAGVFFVGVCVCANLSIEHA